MKIYSLLAALLLIAACQQKAKETDYLGIVNLTVTGNKQALPHFEKGLLLLHNFEYADALESFEMAKEADPEMSMAYWGEAMTYNHSLWGQQEYERGVAALEEQQAFANQEAITLLEKDFIRAEEILYKPETPKTIRDKAYAEYMAEMYQKYPDNHEVAAFYALSLLGSVSEGRDDEIYGQGAVVVQGILEENPKHPGALHYLIHSYDDPKHAKYALNAANTYSKVATDAGHALHMPSHIYVALGMWDEVVSSNEDSYQASIDRKERKKLDGDARGYHYYHWLEYGYLQKGRFEDAKKMVINMEKFTAEKPSGRARTHMVFLKGTFLVETNDWNSEVADINVDLSGLNVAVRSQYNFLEGMKAFKTGNPALLDASIETIREDYEAEILFITDNGIAVCSGASNEAANQTNIDESKIMELQLLAMKAWMNDDTQLTEELLQASVVMEEALSYSYGPPFIQKPTHELYAEWLMAQDRLEDAVLQYDYTLQRATNRIMTLAGKKKAEEMIKNRPLAQETS